MNKTDFFTAVSYNDNSKSTMLFLFEKVTNYYYLGGKKAAKIILEFAKGSSKNVYLVDAKSSLLTTALKVALSGTIIVLATKAILFLVYKVQGDKRTFAATIIQSACRGHEARMALKKLRADKLEEKQKSTVVVQSAWRGHKARLALKKLRAEKLEEKQKSVVVIQSACRGHEARLALKKRQVKKLEEQKSTAAKKIQKIWRNHSYRVKAKKVERYTLSYALLKKAKPYVDNPSSLRGLSQASSGRTTVYLPKELPIVLKQSGSPNNQKRFDQMKQGHELCERNGYKNLVIPKAGVYGNFIIESRLPIMEEHDTKAQIGFYLDHVEQFMEAVEQFTGFLFQVRLDDITGNTKDAYSTLSKVYIGRYDNVAMYLEEGTGKLGLIDLEGFYLKSKSQQQQGGVSACQGAIRLFPHHFETIMRAAKKFDSNIEIHRKQLEEERGCVLEYFKKAYQEHLDFVKQKNIDLTDPIKFTAISQSRKEEIREAIEVVIRKENDDVWFKDCLGEVLDTTLRLFSEVAFPKILDATIKFITDLLKFNIEYHGGKTAISSYSKLISARTLKFSYGLNAPEYEDLKELIGLKLDMLTFKFEGKKTQFASMIIDGILKELESGKEIAYYNPSFGIGGYAVHCIFC